MNIARSIGAVVAGLLATVACLAVGGWLLQKALGPFVYNDPSPSVLAYVSLLTVELFAIVAGSYLTARLSLSHPLGHAFVSGGVILALSALTALQRFGLSHSGIWQRGYCSLYLLLGSAVHCATRNERRA